MLSLLSLHDSSSEDDEEEMTACDHNAGIKSVRPGTNLHNNAPSPLHAASACEDAPDSSSAS